MNRANFLYLLCAVLSSSLLEYVDAQDSFNVIKSIDALTRSIKDLQTKIDMQASALNNFVTKEELESMRESLEAKAGIHENTLINLEAKLDAQHALLINLNTKDDEQVASLSKLELQTDMQVTTLKKLDTDLGNQTNLMAKIDMQASVLNNFVTKEELESMQETYLKSFKATAERHENALINLEAKLDAQHALLTNLNTKDEEQVASLSKLELQTDMQVTTLKKLDTDLGNQTNLMTNLTTKVDFEATLLKSLGDNITQGFSEVKEILSRKSKCALSSSLTKGVVEGIIAGTQSGVVIIPLDSREPRHISSTNTQGVAFDWITRKIYWIELNVGIKRANLDGSSVELLISDKSNLWGLAVDAITGNFYYGEWGSLAKIRVCNSNGKHCAAIASGANTVGEGNWDIALFPSEGLMFWSSPNDKKVVFRANMDGTNATGIISEDVAGLYLEEVSQRIYWANYNKKTIGSHDLSGNNPNILRNATLKLVDVALDGDTMYFGTFSSPGGIYFVTQNGIVSPITTTTPNVQHIALYGRERVLCRPNPCKSFPCANVCVLTRSSYTCL